MRTLLCLILVLFSSYALADHIRCYSAGKKIFSGYADKIYSIDGVYILQRNNSSKAIFINGDCVGNFTPIDEDEK